MDFIQWLMSQLQPATKEQKIEQNYGTKINPLGRSGPDRAEKAGIPPWLDVLFKSPLADSLFQTVGIPDYIAPLSKDDLATRPSLKGNYTPAFDILKLHPDSSAYSAYLPPEAVLMHEMGHKFQDNQPRKIQRDIEKGKAYAYPSYLASEKGLSRSDLRARDKLDDYARVSDSPPEAYAQAFKNAFNFLRATSRDTANYRELAGKLEGNTPGMGMILQELIKSDLFQKHLLRPALYPPLK